MFEYEKNDWNEIKLFISQKNMIENILTFDVRQMKTKTFTDLKEYL